jgi:hypothetical protein
LEKKIQNQRTAGSQKIKEPLGLGKFGRKKKVQIQRMAGCGYFKSFKEPPGFMKELAMTQQL